MPTGDDPRLESRPGTQAVERALAILECFRGDQPAMGITEIARSVGLNISTAHRLMRALVAAGFMEQEPTTERYRLGIEMAVLGQRALDQLGYDLARPILTQLSEATGESASLGVRRGQEVVVIERSTSIQPLRFDHAAGAELHLHASAMGKVLLAFSGASPTETVAALRSLPAFTPTTIFTRASLIEALTDIARAGVAFNHEERYPGACGVAAPVLGAGGVARAAVGVQGPSVRLTPERLHEIAPLVRRAADELSHLTRVGTRTPGRE